MSGQKNRKGNSHTARGKVAMKKKRARKYRSKG